MACQTRPLRLCVRRRTETRGVVVRTALPSDAAVVEEAVEVLTRHCLAGSAGDPASLRFRLQTVLAEALANAVLRGNGADPAKRVQVTAVLDAAAIRLEIADEGDGFDTGRPVGPGAPDDEGGRGLFLLQTFADALEFNDRGNALCLTLTRR